MAIVIVSTAFYCNIKVHGVITTATASAIKTSDCMIKMDDFSKVTEFTI